MLAFEMLGAAGTGGEQSSAPAVVKNVAPSCPHPLIFESHPEKALVWELISVMDLQVSINLNLMLGLCTASSLVLQCAFHALVSLFCGTLMVSVSVNASGASALHYLPAGVALVWLMPI